MGQMRQHNPPHPGELIMHVYIEPYADVISQREIARRLGVSPTAFNRLAKCETAVTPNMAIRLEKVLGGSAQSWLNMQTAYDLWQAEKEIDQKQLEHLDFELLKAS